MLGLEMVWLIDERVPAVLNSYGAHVSTVSYTKDGIDFHNITVMNDEFWIMRTRDEE